ncbi:amidohydrolase family protein [Shewanella litorisediminis]|uniref:Amidohydrolase family protein n=1 Tax=Shewanella litorisediminis TaxID=1173586 RepID=A0ABX7G6R6_9GAMM|nr:amidohydrolase family protein [Shewanella litorisediminis]MCL2916930.1 amidohydrolase family protein [Shewanella litorisediminis]QRH02907.1 amidohydrolase family protein [Shewanella litorisediminis]
MINNNNLAMLLIGLTLFPIGSHAKTLLTSDPTPLIALQGAKLHLAPGQTLEKGTLLIEGNRIKGVLTGNDIPAGARIVEMAGLDIYPGFIDPFTQYGISFEYPTETKSTPVYEIKRIGGNAANGAVHAEKQWAHFFAPDKDAASSWINNGFTSVQSAKLDGIFRGQGVHVSLADKIANDLVYRAQANHYLSFDKGSSTQDYPSSLMGAIALIRQTLMDAAWYSENRSKLSAAATPGQLEFNAALQGLGNTQEHYFVFDTPDLNNQQRASGLMSEFKLKGALLGNGREYARIDEIKAKGYPLILPLNFPAAPDVSQPGTEYQLKLADLRHWERAAGNGQALEQAGIGFALTLHGIEDKKDFWPRLQKAIKAGLSEQTALAALTTQAATIAGVADTAGKLSPGFVADLAIYQGNPFSDGKLVSVFLQGQEKVIIPREQLAVTGSYTVTINDQAVPLEVTYEQGLKLKVEDKSAPLTGTGTELNTRIELPGFEGKPRLTLDLPALKAVAYSGDGTQTPLTLKKVDNESRADNTPAASESISYVGKLTSPNVAFGRESLPEQDKVHIQGATVWTSESQGVLENADIIISKGKILSIGTDLMTPPGYQRIDGTGKHVTAGIVDEHSHIALNGGTNEGTDAVTSEVRIGDVLDPEDVSLYRSLAGGVTTAQLLHGSANPIGGQSQLIKLRWGVNAEGLKYQGAPASIKFALGENVKQSNWGDDFTIRFPQSRMGVESVMADAFDAAREYQRDIKAYNALDKRRRAERVSPRPNLRLEAVAEVLDKERDVHIHSYVQSEILMFLRLAETYGFKVKAFTHVLEGYKVAKELAAHGAGASTFSDWWAYKFEVYDAIVQNACLMHQAGVLTSLNSDSFEMQRRLNQEAAKSMMYCDMSAEDAWKMITINPARQLGIDKDTGSLKEGKVADLVLWDTNPLSVYARTEAVWIDGKRFYDRETDKQMQAAQASEREALVAKILSLDESEKAGEQPEQKQEPLWHCDSHYIAFGTRATYQGAQHQHQGAH